MPPVATKFHVIQHHLLGWACFVALARMVSVVLLHSSALVINNDGINSPHAQQLLFARQHCALTTIKILTETTATTKKEQQQRLQQRQTG